MVMQRLKENCLNNITVIHLQVKNSFCKKSLFFDRETGNPAALPCQSKQILNRAES